MSTVLVIPAAKRDTCKPAPFCPPEGCHRPGCLVNQPHPERTP